MEISCPRELLPQQYRFITSQATFKLYSGAFGAGKTLAGAHHMILHCLQNKRVLWLATCQTYPMLKDSVLRTVLNELDLYQKAFDEAGLRINIVAHFNRSENKIVLFNGSEMIFRSADKASKFKSINLDGFWIDEAVDVPESIFLMLQGRLRNTGPAKKFGILTSNPDNTENWVYKKFLDPRTKLQDSAVFHSSTYDNHYLEESFIRNLEDSFDKDYAERYLKGKWGSFKGLIFPEFSKQEHVTTPKLYWKHYPPIEYYIGGYDDGFKAPCCFLLIGVSGGTHPHFFVSKEFFREGLSPSLIAQEVKRIYSRWGVLVVYCDPSAANIQAEFRNLGMVVRPANPSVHEGIKHLKALIHERRLHINDECVNLIRELQNYKWKRDRLGNELEIPFKHDDHAIDALRYALFTHNLERAIHNPQNLTDEILAGNFSEQCSIMI